MGYPSRIVRGPNQLYPRYIFFVVKFMQLFEQKSLVLAFEVDHPEPTFGFRTADQIPSRR